MATKINQAFYGAEDTFINNSGTTYAKHSAYSLGDLISSGKYTGGSLDTSAAPWGIGKSSMSSEYWMFLTKGAEWTYNHGENQRKNSPLYLYFQTSWVLGSGTPAQFVGADVNAYNFTSGCYKNRVYPAVKYDSGRFKSSLDIDYNDTISLTNSETVCPITYADYQHLRAFVDTIVYIPTSGSSLQTTTLPNLLNGTTTNIKKIVRINWGIRDTDNNYTSINFSVGGAESDIPELFRQCYYGDETKWVRPCRFIDVIGLWSDDWYVFNTNDCASTSSFEEVTASNPVFPYVRTTAWGTASDTEQAFDDITYKWVYGFCKNNGASIQDWTTPIETGELYDATSLYGGVVYLDCGEDATPQDYANAILHEIAFLGFPFIKQLSDYNKPIGDANVYLPVFDDHMITTGNYVAGSDSLTLPNAQWGDIFGSNMPEYDPTYDPDPPTPPDPEDDEGDLNNLGHNRYMGKGLKVYVMPTANYTQSFLPALNALYQNKTPDDWTVDFQGENPSNYIVAAFNTFFAVPTQGITTNITLGVVDTGISADVYDRGKPQAETFTFGTRHINPVYNDFRDYAPYTNIELYLPLCGTIPLETAYVMNHDITITYWYDITTMSCTACVYRDNMLYKTLDGSLGVPAPLLSSDMGNYQNQIKQLENAKTQNNMRIATSAVSLTAGIAAAVASGGTAIVPEVMGIAGGVAGLTKAMETANEIQYKIEHTAPSISTTGASESQNNMCVGQLIPKLIIKRPLMLPNKNDAIYSKTVGNACCINNSVGDNSGLIKCSNVDLSGVTATAAEISAIQNLLTSGVYV